MRAGLFSQPGAIRTINSYCVAVEIDKNAVHKQGEVEARLFSPLSPVAAHVLSPAGVTLAERRLEAVDGLLDDIVQQARILKVSAGMAVEPVAVEKPAVPGGIVLSLTARLLAPTPEEAFQLPLNPPFRIPLNIKALPDPEQMYQMRFRAPTFERLVLSREDVESLVGGALAGRSSWSVDAAAARHLLWLFRPPTHYPHPLPTDVKAAQLAGRVTQLDGDRVHVRLDGSFNIRHRWFPTASEGVWLGNVDRHGHWAEGRMTAECVVSLATRTVVSFEMASLDAVYRGSDGTVMPFGVEASMAP